MEEVFVTALKRINAKSTAIYWNKIEKDLTEGANVVAMNDLTIYDVYEDILKQTLLFQHIRVVSGDACIERIGKGLDSLRNGLQAYVWHPGIDVCLINGNPYRAHEMAHSVIWKNLNECLNNSYNLFLSKQYSRALDCVCYAFDLFVQYIDKYDIQVSMVKPLIEKHFVIPY
jgi:hypothetical protein